MATFALAIAFAINGLQPDIFLALYVLAQNLMPASAGLWTKNPELCTNTSYILLITCMA